MQIYNLADVFGSGRRSACSMAQCPSPRTGRQVCSRNNSRPPNRLRTPYGYVCVPLDLAVWLRRMVCGEEDRAQRVRAADTAREWGATMRTAAHTGLRASFALLGFWLGGAGSAVAADVPAPPLPPAVEQTLPVPTGWTVRLTPYVWAPSLNGTQTVRGRTVDVDVSFYDLARKILEHGDTLIGAMGNIEARNGPFSFYADGVYTLINVSTNISRYRDISPRVSATLDAALDLRIQMGIAEAGAAYEIARFGVPFGPSTTLPVAIDVLAGARYWYQRFDFSFRLDRILDINALALRDGPPELAGNPDLLDILAQGRRVAPGTLNLNELFARGDRLALASALAQNGLDLRRNRAIARSGTIEWVDPLVGGRVRLDIAPGHELFVRGDVGGFGVGSKFSWQAVGGYSFDYAVQNGITYSGLIGYKALYADYAQGQGRRRYEFDMLQHGPVVGISLRW